MFSYLKYFNDVLGDKFSLKLGRPHNLNIIYIIEYDSNLLTKFSFGT